MTGFGYDFPFKSARDDGELGAVSGSSSPAANFPGRLFRIPVFLLENYFGPKFFSEFFQRISQR
jgi:hypothetical protein